MDTTTNIEDNSRNNEESVEDYWFGYSDSSSAGSHDPARECFVVAVGDKVDGASSAGAGDGELPRDTGPSAPGTRG
jgi:hypothetical protein